MAEFVKGSTQRKADHPILDIFVDRWSPRAMSGEAIDDVTLMRLFEAARWAPSSYNEQPWRFLYATRDSEHWQTFVDLLVEANQAWAHRAAVLILIISKRTFTKNGKPNPVHSFDCGSAWQSLALQGTAMGLVTHGMAGFHASKARHALNIPEDYDTEAMVAIGKPGDVQYLPEELRQAEAINDRRPIHETVCKGPWQG